MSPEKGSSEDGQAAADQGLERGAALVEHLQAATLELIAAGRAFLDVLEQVMNDPGRLLHVVTGMRPPDGRRAEARPVERIDVQDGRSTNGG